jgi:aspartate kinase
VSLITVEGNGMLGVPGIAARTFGAVARTDTSVLLISQASSEQSICFVVPQASAQAAAESVIEEFRPELARRDIDRIWVQEDVTIVTVVGAGIRGTAGIAGQVFSAAGQRGINVIAIAQGSSECGISLVVDAQHGDEAVRAIHVLTVAERPRPQGK